MNILLADDIQGWLDFNRKNLEYFLKDTDLNFYAFNSAKEAYDFSFTFSGKIDLVISDLEMEPMYDEPAGAWLIKNLKTIKATQNARYVIISSSAFINRIAEDVDADAFLRKPAYQANPQSLDYLLQSMFRSIVK